MPKRLFFFSFLKPRETERRRGEFLPLLKRKEEKTREGEGG
jgi:hypothetical protein